MKAKFLISFKECLFSSFFVSVFLCLKFLLIIFVNYMFCRVCLRYCGIGSNVTINREAHPKSN